MSAFEHIFMKGAGESEEHQNNNNKEVHWADIVVL